MKIALFNPKTDFTNQQQEQLSKLGKVVYIESPMEHPLEELIKLADGAEFLAVDPDNFGGFETAKEKQWKPNQAYRIEGKESAQVVVLISDKEVGAGGQRLMPDIYRNKLELIVSTKSGQEFSIPIKTSWIIKG